VWGEGRRAPVTNQAQNRGVSLGIVGEGTRVRGIPLGTGVRFQFKIPNHSIVIEVSKYQFRILRLNIFIQKECK
jgi:hypothetical protein